MTSQDNIKPFIDRILSNPLHFKPATSKQISSSISSELLKNPSYIVIKADSNTRSTENKKKQVDSDMIINKEKVEVKRVKLPKSMAEALALYTSSTKTKNTNAFVEKENIGKITKLASPQPSETLPTSPEDFDVSDNNSSNEVFHEAKEYIDFDEASSDNTIGKDMDSKNNVESDSNEQKEDEDIGEDIGEDLGEDLGVPLIVNKNDDTDESKYEQSDSSSETTPESTNVRKTESKITNNAIEEESDEEESDEDFDMDTDKVESTEESHNTSEGNTDESEDYDKAITDSEKLDLRNESVEYEKERQKAIQLKKLNLDIAMLGTPNSIDENENHNLKEEEEEEELEHKVPKSRRSVTPPSTTSDIDKFYKFNEEVNDEGSILPSRIIKNWGPELSSLKPRGLLNHGVTCYTNAAVQAMLHIPAIQHYLFDILQGKYSDTISSNSVSVTFAETSKKMWLPNDRFKKKNVSYIDPKRLIANLDNINCMMSEWQQEDSHEYFMSLMSRLQEDSVPKGHKLTESIIYDIFGGLLKQCVTCKSCGEVSRTEQPFYDLSLHLKGKKTPDSQNSNENNSLKGNDDNNTKLNDSSAQIADNNESSTTANGSSENGAAVNRRFSIEKSIKDFFNPELIKVDSEQKGYICEKCHKTTNAVKRNSILRAPETLLVHLKKFRYNGTSSSKMKQAVSYPMFLDLTEYCDLEDKPKNKNILPVKYQLISVVVHEGRSLSSGHYVAHCKQPDGSWENYDDEYINKMTERDVLREPNAYYLVYTRLTPKAIKLKKTLLQGKNIGLPGSNNNKFESNNNKASSNKFSNNKNKKNKDWKQNKKRRFNKY